MSVIAGVSFVVGVIATMAGAAWGLRGAIEKRVGAASRDLEEELEGKLKDIVDRFERTLQAHVDAEHGKDQGGMTLRERIILVESGMQSLRRTIERRGEE